MANKKRTLQYETMWGPDNGVSICVKLNVTMSYT